MLWKPTHTSRPLPSEAVWRELLTEAEFYQLQVSYEMCVHLGINQNALLYPRYEPRTHIFRSLPLSWLYYDATHFSGSVAQLWKRETSNLLVLGSILRYSSEYDYCLNENNFYIRTISLLSSFDTIKRLVSISKSISWPSECPSFCPFCNIMFRERTCLITN